MLSTDEAGFGAQPPLFGAEVWGRFAGDPRAGGDAHPGAGRPGPSCPACAQVSPWEAVSLHLLPISGCS